MDQKCDTYYLGEGCKKLKASESIPIHVYKGKMICKKPLPPQYTMENMVIPALNDDACPDGLKMCGRYMYKYFKTCFPKDMLCPINDLKIAELTDDIKKQIETGVPANKLLGAIKWTYVKLNEEEAIALTTEENQMPMVSLIVAEDNPCTNF